MGEKGHGFKGVMGERDHGKVIIVKKDHEVKRIIGGKRTWDERHHKRKGIMC